MLDQAMFITGALVATCIALILIGVLVGTPYIHLRMDDPTRPSLRLAALLGEQVLVGWIALLAYGIIWALGKSLMHFIKNVPAVW